MPKPTPKSKPKKPAPKAKAMPTRRADFGAPIEGYFARQPPPQRAILDALRAMIEEAAPDATASIKWGMPFFSLGDSMMVAMAAHKSHVNLLLPGAPGTYPDPDGRLEGEGKTGQHLKIHTVADLPRTAVRAWLRKAATLARAKS